MISHTVYELVPDVDGMHVGTSKHALIKNTYLFPC